MNKTVEILTAICSAMCCVLVLLELPKFIFTSAITDQDVSILSKSIFIPLFVIGLIISAYLKYKKANNLLLPVGLLFMGASVILLAFLNVYNLQMFLPLLKTNSISLVVMWVARIIGGLVGLYCGFALGSILTKGILKYVCFVLSAVLTYLLCMLAPHKISYEIMFYIAGILSFITEVIFVFSNSKIKEK